MLIRHLKVKNTVFAMIDITKNRIFSVLKLIIFFFLEVLCNNSQLCSWPETIGSTKNVPFHFALVFTFSFEGGGGFHC